MDNLKRLTDGELAYLHQRELNTLLSGLNAAWAVLIETGDNRVKHSTGRRMLAAMWRERRRLRRQWEAAMALPAPSKEE